MRARAGRMAGADGALAGAVLAGSSWRMASRCEVRPAEGPALPATGTVTPARTSSVRGAVRVSTLPNAGAAASRAVSGDRPQRCSTVARIDVWSSGTDPAGTREEG